MDFIERISWRVIEFLAAENPEQIAQTQCVRDYTRLLAEKSGIEPRRLLLLEIAALLHDIGCPAARTKYGDSKAPHQECEGERIVREWLPDYPELTCRETDWIARVVGCHHRAVPMRELGAETLLEADLIVNLLEGALSRQSVEKSIRSTAGRELFTILFPAHDGSTREEE